jgi:cation-transporting P-type ATPase C
MADALGVDAVRAELRPEEKAGVIEEYKRRGRTIAFVGDGVNDAPALAAAHVGMAMPRGALIARETADVILLQDDLAAIADARDLAARTQGLIRTNFRVAAGVNSGIILAAALGRLSPVAASVLHNGTTLGILLNALSGVSLSRDRTEQAIERLKTLREAYREG